MVYAALASKVPKECLSVDTIAGWLFVIRCSMTAPVTIMHAKRIDVRTTCGTFQKRPTRNQSAGRITCA
jgi:hypothetical protein